MCNLYRMNQAIAEVAKLFGATGEVSGNVGSEVYPGYPGWVVVSGHLRPMTWGFPLTLKGKDGLPLKPKPVNNTRTDKLESSFWRPSCINRRALIPVTAFAEPEGRKGSMTRTWLSLPDTETFLCAGIWRESIEWGSVYSMVMTEASNATKNVHDRMPVILHPKDSDQWLAGSPEEALTLCKPYAGTIHIERTAEPWVRRSGRLPLS